MTRTDAQNRYFRGVIVPAIAKAMNIKDHGIVAGIIKGLPEVSYLLREISDDKKFFRIKSTKELSTVEFEDLMSIFRWWACKTFKLIIPLPNGEPVSD